MPFKRRNGTYYVKRKFGPLGKITKTLDTTNRHTAGQREGALITLRNKGKWKIIKAFRDDRLSIDKITKKVNKKAFGELEQLLKDSVTLEEAIEETIRRVRLDGLKKETRRDYAAKMKQYRWFLAWIQSFRNRLENGKLPLTVPREREPGHSIWSHLRDQHQKTLKAFRKLVRRSVPTREALTTENLAEFKHFRLEFQGRAKQTVNNDLNALSRLADVAVDKDWLDEKPSFKRYGYKTRIRWLTAKQMSAYLGEFEDPLKLMMDLLLTTGMRLGEAQALRKQDVKVEKGGVELSVDTNKTNRGTRPVPLSRRLGESLREYAEQLGAGDHLFTTPTRTIQKMHNRVCDRLGITDYTIHDHRHTAAVHMAKNGVALQIIKEFLGHQNLKSTMKYAQYRPVRSRMVADLELVEEKLGRRTADDA